MLSLNKRINNNALKTIALNEAKLLYSKKELTENFKCIINLKVTELGRGSFKCHNKLKK
jgi:hypothetical protein